MKRSLQNGASVSLFVSLSSTWKAVHKNLGTHSTQRWKLHDIVYLAYISSGAMCYKFEFSPQSRVSNPVNTVALIKASVEPTRPRGVHELKRSLKMSDIESVSVKRSLQSIELCTRSTHNLHFLQSDKNRMTSLSF